MIMVTTPRTQNRYGIRLRELVGTTRDVSCAAQCGGPRSTVRGWLNAPSTWYRLIRDRHWRRPRQRVHPAKPKIGIRASHPNEIWHVDTTVVRLLDASRVYLQAVIDNDSRRILAWKVSGTFNPSLTAELLLTASKRVGGGKPKLLADQGVENVNHTVDRLANAGLLKRVLAQTDMTFSNSLIESW